MSEQSKEAFENWFKENAPVHLRAVRLASMAWQHQQSKIDVLAAENAALRAQLAVSRSLALRDASDACYTVRMKAFNNSAENAAYECIEAIKTLRDQCATQQAPSGEELQKLLNNAYAKGRDDANAARDLMAQQAPVDHIEDKLEMVDEREAFEAWAVKNNKFHTSGYNPSSDLFEAWQARAALKPAVPEDAARLDFFIDAFIDQCNGNAVKSFLLNAEFSDIDSSELTKESVRYGIDKAMLAAAKDGEA